MRNLFRVVCGAAALIFVFNGFTNVQAQTWEPTSGPLGGGTKAISINSAGDIFIGSRSGVFRSTSNGDREIDPKNRTGS